MMIFLLIVRLIQSIIVVTDTAQNIVFRQFLYEFSFEMGFTTLGVYLFGIIHALRESDRVIFDQWIYSPRVADILCTAIIVGPYVTNTTCSLGAGISAYLGHTDMANDFASALYIVWSGHCLALSSLTLFAGWRLLRILNQHIKMKEERKTTIDISKVKLGAQKVKIIALTSSICLFLYIGVAIGYGVFRVPIHTHVPYSIFLIIAWNGLGILASMFISFAVILHPKMKLSLLFTSDTSGAGRSHGMELDSSKRNDSSNSNKMTTSNNFNFETSAGNSNHIDSAFDTHTFTDSMQYTSKISDVGAQYNNEGRNYTSMDAAPTLSTAIAMKYSNASNPLVLDDCDMELVHAYPESTKSCSHLVDDKISRY
ncbi:uncharacterized protein BX664DRAFT_316942 [Halteromyces radiatus]|uniref:uncharacterized protein n=1 Tax=Halteromyces radiatus TaxID=101107 RepID=UPI00221ECF47|nr:uncharacterized protein BX664DRAFT_316942 [Halteromyces radiatus]KAI8082937.1 hypothetical protein BX664DRAFT_316942 [Halteromyces radiatus]